MSLRSLPTVHSAPPTGPEAEFMTTYLDALTLVERLHRLLLDVIKDEWARLVNEGVSQEELDVTKTFLTGAYPLRFDGNGPIANILVGMQMQGLPKNYINTRNDNVNAVTLEEINRVIKDVYLPDELHFTVVGKPEGLD